MSSAARPESKRLSRRRFIGTVLTGSLAGVALVLPSCAWDGNFSVLGYSTRPNYDCGIRTVRVPMFENATIWHGLEQELTLAVVREIEQRTPYKVVSAESAADTELTGKVVAFNKLLLNRTQLNEVREAQTTLAVEVVWRDLRSGEVLSRPGANKARLPGVPAPGEPGAPPPPPVLVQSVAGFIPEVGESITSARKQNVDRMAIQVISMMEAPW